MTTSRPPLVIDLDGTLTPTDTLVEAIVKLVKQSPLNLLRLPIWLMKGKAAFKSHIAGQTRLSAESLPYREELLDYLRTQKAQGRRIILATASHKSVANEVSQHIGIFDGVIATETLNLKGSQKLHAIQESLGENFVYGGDSPADIPIWKAAKGAILVGASKSTANTVRLTTPIEAEFPQLPLTLRTWSRALRIHQWLKNLLIFVPMLTAFSFLNTSTLIAATMAFFAFSLAASSTYVVNDLWDLDSDRIHPRKRFRPLASAEIPIIKVLSVAAACLFTGLVLAWMVSTAFLLILLLYLVITSSYSWALKQYVLIDVIILSLLYTLRIFAGSIAIGVTTGTWLLAFSVFVFLSLALVKRCSELVTLETTGGTQTSGRDYSVHDLVVLWPLGVGAAVSAVVVFGLFINAPETADHYASPLLLWLVALGLIYWLSRLWIKTGRGEMHDDPVVYAIKDKASRLVVVLMAAIMAAAHYVELSFSL